MGHRSGSRRWAGVLALVCSGLPASRRQTSGCAGRRGGVVTVCSAALGSAGDRRTCGKTGRARSFRWTETARSGVRRHSGGVLRSLALFQHFSSLAQGGPDVHTLLPRNLHARSHSSNSVSASTFGTSLLLPAEMRCAGVQQRPTTVWNSPGAKVCETATCEPCQLRAFVLGSQSNLMEAASSSGDNPDTEPVQEAAKARLFLTVSAGECGQASPQAGGGAHAPPSPVTTHSGLRNASNAVPALPEAAHVSPPARGCAVPCPCVPYCGIPAEGGAGWRGLLRPQAHGGCPCAKERWARPQTSILLSPSPPPSPSNASGTVTPLSCRCCASGGVCPGPQVRDCNLASDAASNATPDPDTPLPHGAPSGADAQGGSMGRGGSGRTVSTEELEMRRRIAAAGLSSVARFDDDGDDDDDDYDGFPHDDRPPASEASPSRGSVRDGPQGLASSAVVGLPSASACALASAAGSAFSRASPKEGAAAAPRATLPASLASAGFCPAPGDPVLAKGAAWSCKEGFASPGTPEILRPLATAGGLVAGSPLAPTAFAAPTCSSPAAMGAPQHLIRVGAPGPGSRDAPPRLGSAPTLLSADARQASAHSGSSADSPSRSVHRNVPGSAPLPSLPRLVPGGGTVSSSSGADACAEFRNSSRDSLIAEVIRLRRKLGEAGGRADAAAAEAAMLRGAVNAASAPPRRRRSAGAGAGTGAGAGSGVAAGTPRRDATTGAVQGPASAGRARPQHRGGRRRRKRTRSFDEREREEGWGGSGVFLPRHQQVAAALATAASAATGQRCDASAAATRALQNSSAAPAGKRLCGPGAVVA